MMIVGFILLAAAAVVAGALIVQNPGTVTVHAFKWSWDVEMRWLIVAGLALSAIGLLGLAMMRIGDSYNQLLRGERAALAAENKRLDRQAGADNRRPAAYEHRHSAQRAS
jgi:ABC-type branched-subunit amino acid transport system permease subunit